MKLSNLQSRRERQRHIVPITNRNKNSMIYMTQKQKIELMHEANSDAVILLDFYLSKARSTSFDYSDAATAKILGLTERKVGNIRRLLIKVGWFKQTSTSNRITGFACDHIYMGKENCKKVWNQQDIIDENKIQVYIMNNLNLKDWADVQSIPLEILNPLVEEADRLIEAGKL